MYGYDKQEHIYLIYTCMCLCMDVYKSATLVYVYIYIYIYIYVYATETFNVWNHLFLSLSIPDMFKHSMLI